MGVFSEQQALYAVVMVCLALVLMMVITLILMYRRSAAAEKQAKEMAAIVQEKLSQTSEAERINEEQARREIGETVRNVILTVYEGEILGIGGMAGQGKLGIANGIMGLHPAGGSVSFEGRAIELNNPESPLAAGISAVSEDRRGVGLLLEESIAWNIIFTSLQMQGRFLRQFGPVKIRDEEGIAECARKYIRDLEIKCTSERQHVQELSGGNQQKVILGKWLAADSQIIIFDEPTKGIDIGSKSEIYVLMRKLADEGKAVMVVSSELPELLAVCDTIHVFREGQIVKTFPHREATEENIIKASTAEIA